MQLRTLLARPKALSFACIAILSAWAMMAFPGQGASQTVNGAILAQKLVEEVHKNYPETTEVGISAQTSRGCRTIASTDPGDIGERCEKDDEEPMHSGKPFVEKEKDGFDVTLPLHDAKGELVGTVGIEFKANSGQSRSAVVARAQKIAREMEAKIPSKSELLATVK